MRDSIDRNEIREMALAIGELHGSLLQELNAYFALAENERADRAQDALGQLRSQDLVTDEEAAHLKAILESARNVNMTDPQIAEEVAKSNQELKDANAGAVALALAGIAANSSQFEAKRAVDEGRADSLGDGPIGAADCEGGMIGATVGAAAGLATGQPELVLAGALGGAAAGSLAAWLAE